jgi:class 3 adenylate cyclase
VAEERVERRLAAILAADVAGYSRMMGANEIGTLAALKAHRRELIDPKIAEHNGRFVKAGGLRARSRYRRQSRQIRTANRQLNRPPPCRHDLRPHLANQRPAYKAAQPR